MNLEIIRADYSKPQHEQAIQQLLDAYAHDPMGGGEPLKPEAKENVVRELAKIPHAFSLIAYLDNTPVGLANCFEAFSTFACKPIINIHDLAVLENCRGKGIGQKLLEKVEEIAKSQGCCKITLEVLDGNEAAKSVYKKFGFSSYVLSEETGKAFFWQKKLDIA